MIKRVEKDEDSSKKGNFFYKLLQFTDGSRFMQQKPGWPIPSVLRSQIFSSDILCSKVVLANQG